MCFIKIILSVLLTYHDRWWISNKETEYLNRNFGFEYTTEELMDIYESHEEEVRYCFDEKFENEIIIMYSVNEKLRMHIRDFLIWFAW